MNIRAIDLGYGNVKYCNGEPNGSGKLDCNHFPSIARPHTGIDRGASVMTHRDLFLVESQGSHYLVGKDSIDTLSARDDQSGHLLENYIDTPQYLALLRGSLIYADCPDIDLLVCGLPVNHFADKKAKLKELLVGIHRYPDGSTISVKDAWIVPQPTGGFIEYFVSGSTLESLNNIRSLTIDVGYFTLDWLTCRGLKMQEERSGSTPGGMSLVLDRLCELVSVDRKAHFTNHGILDEGIRNNYKARIQGKEYDFSHLIDKMQSQILSAVQSIARSVGALDDIDVVVMVGGGASCYQPVVEKVLNREVIVPDASLYANVKGFYRAGKQRLNQTN